MECDKKNFLLLFDGDSESFLLLPELILQVFEINVCTWSVLGVSDHLSLLRVLIHPCLISFDFILNDFHARVSNLILNQESMEISEVGVCVEHV